MQNDNRFIIINTPSSVHVSRAVFWTLQVSTLLPVQGWTDSAVTVMHIACSYSVDDKILTGHLAAS